MVDKIVDIRDVLTDLFLDTEFTERDAKVIASHCCRSELSVEEIEKILINEVSLICLPHLASGVGPWAGWPIGWVEEKLNDSEFHKLWVGFDYEDNFNSLVKDDWQKVKDLISKLNNESDLKR